jgi:hypothetical protein
VDVDANNGATGGAEFAGWDFNFFFAGVGMANSAAFQPVRTSTSNESAILNLAYGTLVNGASTFSTGAGGSGDIGNEHVGPIASQFQDGAQGYLGFKFTKNNTSGPFYGWMRVTLTGNTPGGSIHDWAWDDSGASIAVPEPGRAMLLILGVLGIALRRKRVCARLKVTGS